MLDVKYNTGRLNLNEKQRIIKLKDSMQLNSKRALEDLYMLSSRKLNVKPN